MRDQLQIFISYSWHNKDIVDQIDRDMQSMGIILIRDIRDLQYKDSILEFMKSIRKSDYVLLIVSDSYLRSRNCMFEIQELIKDDDYSDRILPIVLDQADIFSSEGRLKYIKYWEQELNSLEELIKTSDIKNVGSAINDLRIVNQICTSIGDFIASLSDMKHIPVSELSRNGYRDILEIVGIPDANLLERLREIEAIEDQEEQDLQIEQFLRSHPKHVLGNMIKGMLEEKRGNYKKARYTYETAIADLTDSGYDESSWSSPGLTDTPKS